MKAILLALAAGLAWGVGEIFTKSVLHGGRVGPLTAIAVRTTVALPVLWAACAAATLGWKTEPRDWAAAGASTLLKLVLGSGLVAGAAGMIFFYAALGAGEISRVKPIAFSVAPAVAVLLGALVLGEPLTARKLAAVGLIIAGVVMLSTPAR